MRSNALRKQDHHHHAQGERQGRAPVRPQRWSPARIARQAEECCHLPGNEEAPDFEEFAVKYRLIISDFA